MSPRCACDQRTTIAVVRGLLCLLALQFSISEVKAQAVYKSVGPGGKVVYTDKPVRQPDSRLTPVDAVEYANSGARFDASTRWSDPAFSARRSGDPAADAALETSRRAAVTAAEEAARATAQAYQTRVEASRNKPGPVAPAATPVPAAAVPAVAKSEPAPPAALASPPSRAAPDPKVEKAVLEMMSTQHLVEQAVLVCSANQPGDAPRFAVVMAKWRERNASLILRQQKALYASLTIAQIRDLEETATTANRTKLERGNAVVEEVRLKWCTQIMGDINKGVMDLVAKPELAATLASAR